MEILQTLSAITLIFVGAVFTRHTLRRIVLHKGTHHV
mgnify:CR=1 FL=1